MNRGGGNSYPSFLDLSHCISLSFNIFSNVWGTAEHAGVVRVKGDALKH